MQPVMELYDLYREWFLAEDTAERADIWARMQHIYTDNVFTIGTVSHVPQPVVIADVLKNVPEKAVYNWDSGGYFGIYRMDLFFRSYAVEVGTEELPFEQFRRDN